MIHTETRWLLALTAGLALALEIGEVQSQSDDASAATTNSTQNATPEPVSVEAQEAQPQSDQETAPGQEALSADDDSKIPEAIRDAIENQGKMQATMERFVPTEKLSEDRAVSFPNDI